MNAYKWRRRLRLLTILFFIFGIKIFSQEIPQLETFTLNNGLKIYLLQYGNDPVLNIKMVINGGKKNETECEVGYSEIIQLLLKETLNEKQKFILKKENLINCEINKGQTILNTNCLNSDFNKEMELFSTVISKPPFTREKMDKIVSAIGDQYDPENISSVRLSNIFRDLLFYGSKNPLGRNYCQYQIQKVLPEELREFYIEHYTPKKTSLVIYGNFNAKEIKKIIAKHFIKWRSFHREENVKEDIDLILPKIKGREIAFINKPDSERYILKWIRSAPSFKSPEQLAFLVTCNLFDRFLIKKIKEQVNYDNSKFKPASYANGFMEINCTTNQNNITATVKLFDTTLLNFYKLKFTKAEVEEEVKNLKKIYLKTQTREEVLEFYDPLAYNFESQKNYSNNLSAITSLDIEIMMKKYFDPESYKLIIAGKEHGVSDQLKLLGNVTKYQASGFETCNNACKEIVIIKFHCESCYRRGYINVWHFNPNQKNAIKSAKEKVK